MLKTHLSIAALLIAGIGIADDNAEPKPTKQNTITLTINTNDADNQITIDADQEATIVVEAVDAAANNQNVHVRMLRDAAEKLPADDPARQRLEQHVLQLLAPDALGKDTRKNFRSFATSSSESVINNGEYRIAIRSKDGNKTVKVDDLDGKEVFAGPWNTPDDQAKAPKEIRELLATHAAAVEVHTIVVGDGAFAGVHQKLAEEAKAKQPKQGEKPDAKQQQRRPLRDADGRRVY